MNVMIVGLGPMGRKICQCLAARKALQLVGAVDTDPQLTGRDAGTLCGLPPNGVRVTATLSDAMRSVRPDVAILATVSDLERIVPQVEALVAHGLRVVSTCEELSFPWETAPMLAQRLDAAARSQGVAVLATGVNPGFLMDTLPIALTAVCQEVQSIEVHRVQDAAQRRLPFQHKIGAGLSPEAFQLALRGGTLRHIGLVESMQAIASRLGWCLDRTEEVIAPVLATRDLASPTMLVARGSVAGVRQVSQGFEGDALRVRLVFQATIGEPEPYDEVHIQGDPSLRSRIAGAVNGDIATCAVVLNALPLLLDAPPGLRTMADLPPVSYWQ